MKKYPKDAVNVNKDSFWISCPHCWHQMEMLERDEEPWGKDTECVPPHYCYPLSDDIDTTWILEDNFWIRYKL